MRFIAFSFLLSFLPVFCLAETTRVTVDDPGTLAAKIEGKKYSITDLAVTGKINGTDIRTLREMCGLDFDNYVTEGQLQRLDLSAADIVSGGDAYYRDEESGKEFFAKENTIGSHFFENCIALANLVLPASVNAIDERAFMGCFLEQIDVPQENAAFTSQNGGLYTHDLSELIIFAVAMPLPDNGTLAFPEGLVKIRPYACCFLPATVIRFPSTLTTLEAFAFYNASALTEFNIPAKLENLSSTSFMSCPQLATVTIDNANPYLSVQNNVVFDKNKTQLLLYPGGMSDKTYEVPSTVTQIGECAFYYNQNIEHVDIGSNVKEIGNSAFANCSSLQDISIPNSIKRLNDFTFQGCSSLSSVSLPDEMESLGAWTFDGTALTEFSFPSGITELGDGLFFDCAGITEFKLPDTIEKIGESVFYQCYSAKSINIPAAVKSIGAYAFMSCSSLAGRVEIPEGITELHYATFMWDSQISELALPSSLQNVGDFALVGLSALQKLESKAVTPPACGVEVFFRTPESAMLFVPAEAVETYKSASPWNIFNIQAFSGISDVIDNADVPQRIYGLDGLPKATARGFSIIVGKDGKSRKVIVK